LKLRPFHVELDVSVLFRPLAQIEEESYEPALHRKQHTKHDQDAELRAIDERGFLGPEAHRAGKQARAAADHHGSHRGQGVPRHRRGWSRHRREGAKVKPANAERAKVKAATADLSRRSRERAKVKAVNADLSRRSREWAKVKAAKADHRSVLVFRRNHES
jgi:hypothetical protein